MKNKNNRILIIGINFLPELTGIGKYTGEMVTWLTDHGYECSVVTGFPYYPDWKIQSPYKGRFYQKEVLKQGRLRLYRCPLYVPKKPSGLKRIVHDASFFAAAFLAIVCLLFGRKHDFIFCAAPPFHLGFLGLFYRFFNGGKLIYHIQDLQIDAAKDLGIIKSDNLINVLLKLEKLILRRADQISSISNGMIRKIKRKINKDVLLFPNWVDTELFHPVPNVEDIKQRYGFSRCDKIVLYSGSIGEKQGLDAIIDAARELQTETIIKFVICGTGPYKEKLQDAAEQLNLKNVRFFPLQPLERLNELLNLADVHLVLQKAGASDLVMPSKLTTILSVGGLAIVTANHDSGLYETVNTHEIGILIKAEDTPELINGIKHAVQSDHRQIKDNARRYAENCLSVNSILPNFMDAL